jgi:hypothetical protein
MVVESTRTRRQLIGSAAAMLGASVLELGAARVLAEPPSFTGPATAVKPAQRLGIDGEMTFPVDPIGGDLELLNGYREGVHKGIDIGNGGRRCGLRWPGERADGPHRQDDLGACVLSRVAPELESPNWLLGGPSAAAAAASRLDNRAASVRRLTDKIS